jgi:hypothetical protein
LTVRNNVIRWVILLILASLLLVSGLAVFAGLAGTQPNGYSLLFNLTGEEALLPQLKGLSDLAAGAMRPRLRTDDYGAGGPRRP